MHPVPEANRETATAEDADDETVAAAAVASLDESTLLLLQPAAGRTQLRPLFDDVAEMAAGPAVPGIPMLPVLAVRINVYRTCD